MERIKNILQRLQELYYSKHQKSAIDVDLMMDYTRVMYADLMEWRKEFKDPPTSETAEKNTGVVTSEAAHEEVKSNTPETETPPANEAEPNAEHEAQPETADETGDEREQEESSPEVAEPVEEPESQKTDVEAQQGIYSPIERDEPPVKEPMPETEEAVVADHPEQEQVNTLMSDATGISFEPPAQSSAQQEIKSGVKEELTVETPAVNQPVEEMPAPAPIEIPLPEMVPPKKAEPSPAAQLFHAAKAANKDIRSSIGINDKYLFLNELFNNHKSNYEETLDKLNHFSTLAQAEDWAITKVAPAQKWEKDDATVQSFYAMLAKHFSDK